MHPGYPNTFPPTPPGYPYFPTTPQASEGLELDGFRQQAQNLKMMVFLETRAYWQSAVISLLRKTRHFGRHRAPGVPWCDIDSCKHPEFSMMWIVPSINHEVFALIPKL